jgi:hypothetical protein
LSQTNIAVIERRRALEFVPTIIVNDRRTTPPSAGLSSTVTTLGRADRGPTPDIQFVQTSSSTGRITSAAYNRRWPSWRSGRNRRGRGAGGAPFRMQCLHTAHHRNRATILGEEALREPAEPGDHGGAATRWAAAAHWQNR